MADTEKMVKEARRTGLLQDGVDIGNPSHAVPSSSLQPFNNTKAYDVPLQTLVDTAFGIGGKKNVRVMFDSGSQKSYVQKSVAQELELKITGEETITHELFCGSRSPPTVCSIVKLYIGNANGHENFNFDVRCPDMIAPKIPTIRHGPWIKEFNRRDIKFSDHSGTSTRSIDVLIGNDVRPHLFTRNIVALADGPVAEETKWGWVLSGKLPGATPSSSNNMVVASLISVDRPLSDLWDLDLIGIKGKAETLKREEIDADTRKHFEQNVKRLHDGRYQEGLPWLISMKEQVPNNFASAVARLKSTTKGLLKDGLLDIYHGLFQQWHKVGMIDKVDKVGDSKWATRLLSYTSCSGEHKQYQYSCQSGVRCFRKSPWSSISQCLCRQGSKHAGINPSNRY